MSSRRPSFSSSRRSPSPSSSKFKSKFQSANKSQYQQHTNNSKRKRSNEQKSSYTNDKSKLSKNKSPSSKSSSLPISISPPSHQSRKRKDAHDTEMHDEENGNDENQDEENDEENDDDDDDDNVNDDDDANENPNGEEEGEEAEDGEEEEEDDDSDVDPPHAPSISSPFNFFSFHYDQEQLPKPKSDHSSSPSSSSSSSLVKCFPIQCESFPSTIHLFASNAMGMEKRLQEECKNNSEKKSNENKVGKKGKIKDKRPEEADESESSESVSVSSVSVVRCLSSLSVENISNINNNNNNDNNPSSTKLLSLKSSNSSSSSLSSIPFSFSHPKDFSIPFSLHSLGFSPSLCAHINAYFENQNKGKKSLPPVSSSSSSLFPFSTSLHSLLFPLLSSYRDIFFPSVSPSPLIQLPVIESVCLHVLNHVLRVKSIVLHHNEKVRKVTKVRGEFQKFQKMKTKFEKIRKRHKKMMKNKRGKKDHNGDGEIMKEDEENEDNGDNMEDEQDGEVKEGTENSKSSSSLANLRSSLSSMESSLPPSIPPLPIFPDSGFTRPRILLLFPTAFHCGQFMEIFMALIPPAHKQQIQNFSRFKDEFMPSNEEKRMDRERLKNRPLSYQSQFGLHSENDSFRVGMKFTRRSLTFYSNFYDSDILLASPLGLRMIIGAEGEDDHDRDYDFLSSMEIVVVMNGEGYEMQNMEHLEMVLDNVNRKPNRATTTKEMDINRCRRWVTEGKGKYFTQFIMFSSYISNNLYNIFHRYSHNYEGKLLLRPSYSGQISHVLSSAKLTFQRIPKVKTVHYDTSNMVSERTNGRIQYFFFEIFPRIRQLADDSHGGVVIFISSYLDFVEIRNEMKRKKLSFCSLNEYSENTDVAYAREQFVHQKCKFLLVTERFYYFKRITNIRGIQHLIFFSLPLNEEFFGEMVQMLTSPSAANCISLFSTWDAMEVERIVGTQRANTLLKSEKETHIFA